MNKIEALKHVYKHNYMVRRIVDRLVLVKPSMNACDIAKVCKIAIGNVYIMVRTYKLKISNRRAKNAADVIRERYLRDLVPKWDENKNIYENAQALNISYSAARRLCGEFSLKARWKNLTLTTMRHIEKIKKYRESGLNDAEIGRCMGMTRERVRQLLLMKDF